MEKNVIDIFDHDDAWKEKGGYDGKGKLTLEQIAYKLKKVVDRVNEYQNTNEENLNEIKILRRKNAKLEKITEEQKSIINTVFKSTAELLSFNRINGTGIQKVEDLIKDEDIIDTTTSKGVVEFFETYWDRIIENDGERGKYFIEFPFTNNTGGVYLSKNENKYNGKIYMTFEREYSLEEVVLSGCTDYGCISMTQIDWYSVFNIKK